MLTGYFQVTCGYFNIGLPECLIPHLKNKLGQYIDMFTSVCLLLTVIMCFNDPIITQLGRRPPPGQNKLRNNCLVNTRGVRGTRGGVKRPHHYIQTNSSLDTHNNSIPVLWSERITTTTADSGQPHRERCLVNIKRATYEVCPPQLSISYINARSVKNKTLSIKDNIIQHDFDIFLTTDVAT